MSYISLIDGHMDEPRLTDVIKALKLCKIPTGKKCCEKCPYFSNKGMCTTYMLSDALNTINNLTDQNEQLKYELKTMSEEVKSHKAEIERLKPFEKKVLESVTINLEENLRLTNENRDLKEVIESMMNEQLKIAFETRKEIERLKEFE